MCVCIYIYIIQGKNKQHFNKNISATVFINSCQHLPNLYTKDLNKNFKGLHISLRLRIVLGGLQFQQFYYSSCSTTGHTSFFVENPMKFLGMLLYPCHFRTKQGFIRGISVVLSTPLLKIPEPKKTKATGNSNFCSYHHRKFYVFFGNLAFYFFDIPRNSVSLTPSPVCYFPGTAQC